jgi:hypothetical protein
MAAGGVLRTADAGWGGEPYLLAEIDGTGADAVGFHLLTPSANTVYITVSSSGQTYQVSTLPSSRTFFGVTSTDAIDWVKVWTLTSYVNLDNFRYHAASIQVNPPVGGGGGGNPPTDPINGGEVPEAGTVMMMLSGIALIASKYVRRSPAGLA